MKGGNSGAGKRVFAFALVLCLCCEHLCPQDVNIINVYDG